MIQPRITTRYNSITQCLNMTSSLSRRCYGRWNLIDTEQYLKEHKSFSDKLKALIDSHDRLNAEKWLEEMKTYGARPSPAVYQELVRFFAEHDRAEDIEKTLDEMAEKKIKPSQFMFDRLIHLYARHQNKEALKRTLKRMEEMDMEPNMETFTEIISAYAKIGAEGDALRTLEHVRKLYGHANAIQYELVLLMLAKHHDWDNFKILWREFEESHEKPTAVMLNTMFSIALNNMKDPKFARHILELMVKYGIDVHPEKYELVKNV